MNFIVWIVIAVALIIFLIFAAWPLYGTYRTRRQGADVREGQEYLKAKEEWQEAEADHKQAAPPAPARPAVGTGVARGDTLLRSGIDPADESGTQQQTGGDPLSAGIAGGEEGRGDRAFAHAARVDEKCPSRNEPPRSPPLITSVISPVPVARIPRRDLQAGHTAFVASSQVPWA